MSSFNNIDRVGNLTRRSFLEAVSLSAAAAGLVGLVGCSSKGSSSQSAASSQSSASGAASAQTSATRTVTDMQGYEVEIPIGVTNYFDAYPINIGVMTMLGTTDSINYVLPRVQDKRWAWLTEVNSRLASLPTIGEDGGVSAEELMKIDPQFVVVQNKETAEEYRRAGLNVFAVTAADSEDFLKAVDKSAELFDDKAQEKAKAYRELYESNLSEAKKRTAEVPASERKSVYYISGKTPYISETGGRGIEILSELATTWAVDIPVGDEAVEVSAETLIAADPDVILVGINTRAAAYEELMADNVLAELKAVKGGQVFMTPQGITPWDTYGPEYALLPLWLGKTIYPERFEDIDIAEELAQFYDDFCDYDLSPEYAERMLAGKTTPTD